MRTGPPAFPRRNLRALTQNGGEAGIRTQEAKNDLPIFETGRFNQLSHLSEISIYLILGNFGSRVHRISIMDEGSLLRRRNTLFRHPPRFSIIKNVAEAEGFEPSSSLTAANGFQDRRFQPLSHASEFKSYL